jgi:hypothetical protein
LIADVTFLANIMHRDQNQEATRQRRSADSRRKLLEINASMPFHLIDTGRAGRRGDTRWQRPMTSLQYLLELQRDWARSDTYELTTGIAKKFGGAYGLGIIYAKTMLGEHASEAG